jgi:precorrin-6B methylase 2
LIPLLIQIGCYCRKQYIIRRWRNALALDDHQPHYESLFKNVDGFSLSKQARATQDAWEYTYGEIDFISFIALLSSISPRSTMIFYDLGSGIGTAVLACAMVFEPQKACGIERFKILHDTALTQQEHLAQWPAYNDIAQRIHFIEGNFLSIDFSDATVVFINATALIGETWDLLVRRLERLDAGTIIITTTKMLKSDYVLLKKTLPIQMSWGIINAFIYEVKPQNDANQTILYKKYKKSAKNQGLP